MDFLRKCAEQIDRQIRPTSFPLAVKLLEKEEDIPEEAQRPKIDFGTCLSTCQGFSMSRKYGISIAMLKEDMW